MPGKNSQQTSPIPKVEDEIFDSPQFTLPIKQMFTEKFLKQEIQPYLDQSYKKKSEFLSKCAEINKTIKYFVSSPMFKNDQPELTRVLIGELGKKLDAYDDAIEAEIESTNQHLKVYLRYNVSSFPDFISKHFGIDLVGRKDDVEVVRFERLLSIFHERIIVVRERRQQLLEEWVDMILDQPGDIMGDWFQVEIMAASQLTRLGYEPPIFNQETGENRLTFRDEVFATYGFQHDADTKKPMGWCCITGQWLPANKMAFFRFVPSALGEDVAEYLFGPQPGGKSYPRVSRALQSGELVLVPDPDNRDIKILVVGSESCPELFKLHKRLLMFQNKARPDRRYLAFAYVMVALVHQRHRGHQSWERLRDCKFEPSRYIRGSTLQEMAVRIGYMSADEANDFAGRKNKEVKIELKKRNILVSYNLLIMIQNMLW
ncbi:hypothetical protein PT974_07996 [Cladobotryum mycophilum]|uniref:Uncharacterized protein n=1 Tax=Cladobotryum mycophilum TaxID=491253 RepID=A0ABR0SC40_9HYPO